MQIGPDAALASACLPLMFQAVEIGGEHYLDGGETGNPGHLSADLAGVTAATVVIVHINPLERAKLPTTATEIINRINEISFNSSLMREMRAIAFVTELIDDFYLRQLDESDADHGIDAADVMAGLGAMDKLNADWESPLYLMKAGRERQRLASSASGCLGPPTVDIRVVTFPTQVRPSPAPGTDSLVLPQAR